MAARKAESLAWLRQAIDDHVFAQSAIHDDRFSHVCVLCQQAAEKAVKSIYLARGMAFPHSHLISEMCRTLKINGKLKLAASVLDQYYVTGRYPIGGSALAPFEMFQHQQAVDALSYALQFIRTAKKFHSKRKSKKK